MLIKLTAAQRLMLKKTLIATSIFVLGGILGIILFNQSDSSDLIAQSDGNKLEVASEQNYRIISFDIPKEVVFAGERIPVEMFYIKESLERELITNTYWHSSTLLLLQRAERWFPVIEPILKKNGIPDDFKYLSMIESNLTNAVSPAGAAGFWQFLDGTAREYGMEVNKNVDERFHIEKATETACQYFLKAYAKYNSWSLVAASYNAGSRRIDGFMTDQLADSYYDLLMAEETERYLFRMVAMKMIIENPSYYGFFPDSNKLHKPLKYNIIKIESSVSNLAQFALKNGISYKLLKYFNPWLRSNELVVTSGKTYEIKIPEDPFNLTYFKIRALNNSGPEKNAR